jgi:hypothetical protein
MEQPDPTGKSDPRRPIGSAGPFDLPVRRDTLWAAVQMGFEWHILNAIISAM